MKYLPSSSILRGTSHNRVRERGLQVVSMVSGMRGPFYSSLRSVPAKINMETSSTAFRRTRTAFPPKGTWTGARVGSADPPLPPLATVLLWYTAWWALVLICWCRGLIGRFGLSGGPLLHVLSRMRSSATLSMYYSCFLLIPYLCS